MRPKKREFRTIQGAVGVVTPGWELPRMVVVVVVGEVACQCCRRQLLACILALGLPPRRRCGVGFSMVGVKV